MNCRLCENQQLECAGVVRNRDYRRCPRCGCAFMDSHFLPDPEEEKARYLTHNNSMEDAGYVKMLSRIVDLAKQWVPRSSNVLDYGCGFAPVLVELLRLAGFSAEGYDPFFFPLELKKEKFDLVTSVEAFEHFASPAREISRIIELLDTQGYLIIQTNLLTDEMDFSKWWYVNDLTHVFFYSLKTFEWIARTYGFKIKFTDGVKYVVMQKNSA
ncbi:class I SAM-dependent methyltransferase [bacterium]|nr:class I SAM-dependent methyltransferase [bacterium]